MVRLIQKIVFLFITCNLILACSGTRHLPKGEKLYTGAEIHLESVGKINKKFIKSTAESGLRPEPNKVYLGIRPKLWMYNFAGDNPTSKIKKWLKKNGEAPVLMRNVKPGVTSAIIDAKLFNIGIFKSFTESKIVEKKRTFSVIYNSHFHKPFVVKDLSYSISDDSISRLVLASKAKSIISPGDDYNLDKLKIERMRIDALLKNNGYFYFSPDYLVFKADTSNLERNVSFQLSLKDSFPLNATTIYRINNVYINQNYSLVGSRKSSVKDSSKFENVIFVGKESQMKVRPEVIMKSVYLRNPDVFSRTNHIITLNRLMSLGNFKLVQVNFAEKDTRLPGLLDVNILMTPLPKRTFRAGIDLVTKSNNFTGPRLNLSLLNRNTFKGAELLSINMAGSFEAQLGGIDKNLYSFSLNPQVELSFPRFLVPFKLKKSNSIFLPKTRLLFSYNYLKRVSYFDLRTFQFVYGFKWKTNSRIEHELNPIDVSYTTVRNKSVVFLDLVNANPFLKKSYEEKFIAGGSYSFTYNEQAETGKKVQYFFQLNSEMTGNLFSLSKIITGGQISSANPSTIAGSVYSQYSKLSLDGRGYYNFTNKNKLAFRLFAGVAVPYGNSSVLPYAKQFFSGGPNSIRAFQINSVGPGTYYQNTATNGFSQLGGDLKLELNSEYRFNIFRYLKGALFLETGNVWLLKSNPSELGSPFAITTFMKELAVGTGFGLRVDVSFFILRFDLAMPLRKPWMTNNSKWVINQIDFSNSAWRRENLILNVAIGYPF